MCGRLVVTSSTKQQLAAVSATRSDPAPGPRYNLAPTQTVPAVLDCEPDAVRWIRWGLIPAWAKDASIGGKLFNARAETVAEKPAFRGPFRRQRCLVLADGFYEWAAVPGQKRRKPYFIAMKDGALFTLAGLWDRWRDPADGHAAISCTLITTRPNDLMRTIHDRMPVILPPAMRDTWLNPKSTIEELAQCLAAYPAEAMELRAASSRVNRAGFDDPSCLEPELDSADPATFRLEG